MKKATKQNLRGLALVELLVIAIIMTALVAIAAPKFIDLKSNARKQALDTIALQLEKNSKFVRAQAFLRGLLINNNKFYIVCLNGYSGKGCGSEGSNNDIITTDMILVQRGYPFSGSHEAVALATLLGYKYSANNYTQLREDISKELPIFPVCNGYCPISSLTNVCNAAYCLQESMEGTLILPQGVSASELCYVKYFHSRTSLPTIAIVNSGC